MNRFNQPVQNASYKPMSFQELSFAPIQMRQREDAMANASDTILAQMNDIVGYEGFDSETDPMKAQMKQKLSDLAGKIQKNGAGNIAYQDEFRNLRNEYNSLVSKTGALGMSSAVKENMDQQREAYYKLGLQMNQSPAAIEAGWAKEVDQYKKQLPSSITKHKGQLPTFTPGMPPPKQDIIAYAGKVANMMGTWKKEWGEPEFRQTGYDENGRPTYDVFDVRGNNITNEEQVQSVIKILENEVMDPNSDIQKDLLYRGYTIPEYLSKVKQYAGVLKNTAESDVVSYKGAYDNGSGGGSSRRSGSTQSTPEAEDTSKLVSLNALQNGSKAVNGTSTFAEIQEREKALQMNSEGLDEETRNRELTSIRIAKGLKLEQIEAYKNSPEFAENINKRIQSDNELNKSYHIDSIEEYNKIKADYEANGENATLVPGALGPDGETELPKSHVMSIINSRMGGLLATSYDKDASEPVLAPTDQLIIGAGPGKEKIEETLTGALGTDLIRDMNAQDRLNIRTTTEGEFASTLESKEGYDEIMQAIESGEATFEFAAFNSGSSMSKPELIYTVRNKKGNRLHDISIELEEDEFTMDLLRENGPFAQNLNKEGRTKLAAIKDSIVYSDLAIVDGSQVPNDKWFDDNNSRNVQKHAIEHYSKIGLTGAVKNSGDPTVIEKYAMDGMFITDNEREKFAVAINPDNSFSSYKKNEEGYVEDYKFEDYYKKGLIQTFLPLNADPKLNAVYHNEFLDSKESEKYKKEIKLDLIESIRSSITDLDNIKASAMIYHDSDTFTNAMKEYHKVYNSNSTQQQKIDAAEKAYDKIKNLRLQSKQRHLTF